jgi:putative acetyltransferase
MNIVRASTQDLGSVRDLFREYAASLPETAQRSLAFQGFEAELAALPGKYQEPAGCIILAREGRTALGVVAMRALDPSGERATDPTPICEMKRMYVRPDARGKGVGRALGAALLAAARNAGYKMMKLDSESDMLHALSLYRSLGFVPIPRYNDDPVSCTVWMGAVL